MFTAGMICSCCVVLRDFVGLMVDLLLVTLGLGLAILFVD